MERTLIEIDLSTRNVEMSPMPDEYIRLGGRGLSSKIISSKVDPACHPLGDGNLFVIAPGYLAGTSLSSCNRLSVGAKSPLTGGIKESNSGGVAGHRLGRLGIGAVTLNGSLSGEGCRTGIRIDSDGVTFEDLSDIEGKGVYASAGYLLERFGADSGLILTGPAGEMGMSTACLSVNDMEGEPCRNLGRGGMGAVLGSKGVKAVIIQAAKTPSAAADPEALKTVTKKFAAMLREHPVTGKKFAELGTVMNIAALNLLGGLPTRNFSAGSFESADAINAESLRKIILERGGLTSHACMPGCVIRCSNKYVNPDGSPLVGSVDYETVCLLGSNLGIGSLDQIAHLNKLCNDYGVDTIEIGNTVGVLAEAGVVAFGDFDAIRGLLEELGRGTPLGRLLGSGAAVCGKVYGVERVPTVKGQGMAAYDPRVIKGMGLTYGRSPMGADHTAGNAITLSVDHSDPQAQLEPVRELHIRTMVLDILGACIFTGRVSLDKTEVLEEMVKAVHGWEASFDDLRAIAKTILLAEEDFNRRAGFTKAHDRLPQFMYEEQLAPTGAVYDIPDETASKLYDFSG
jgi:aldehyde:ferredoxin oxidoreductase